jgi:hypothetical protein
MAGEDRARRIPATALRAACRSACDLGRRSGTTNGHARDSRRCASCSPAEAGLGAQTTARQRANGVLRQVEPEHGDHQEHDQREADLRDPTFTAIDKSRRATLSISRIDLAPSRIGNGKIQQADEIEITPIR